MTIPNTATASPSATAAIPSGRLYPGFGIGLAIVLAGMALSVAVLGLTMPYYNKAASDMVSVYEALLYNSGLLPDFLVYPGLLDRVLLGWWLHFTHALGLVATYRLEDVPAGSDVKAFELTWQRLVEVGRVYSLATGMVLVTVFTLLMRRWIGVWQIAILAGAAWAFSSGNALGYRILRPEMMTSAFVYSGLLIVLIAARDGRSAWRFPALACAGFLVAFAIIDKVQAVIPALTILPIALAFGPSAAMPRSPASARTTIVIALAFTIAGIAALAPAVAILEQGIAAMTSITDTAYKPLSGGLSGRYQIIVAVGIVAAMTAYAGLWRLSVAEAVAGIAAVGFGLGLGFDTLYLQSSVPALVAVANPIEHLQAYSAGDGALLLSKSTAEISGTLLAAVGKGLALHTFILKPTHRPTLLIEWLAIAGAVHAWRNGRPLLAVQIALLIGSAIGQDAIFSLRQVKVYYLPYSDTPILLGGALALTQFTSQFTLPKFERATVALMVAYILWGHAQPALAVFARHDRGKVCGIVTQFTKRMPIPYCQGQIVIPKGTESKDF